MAQILNYEKQTMRTIQQIFNTVIDREFYDYTSFMCIALTVAERQRVITESELQKADKAIHNYMKKLSKGVDYNKTSLEEVLSQKGLPYSYTDRLMIYRDWKNRPTGMLTIGTKVKARAKLVRKHQFGTLTRKSLFIWRRVDTEIEGHIVGIRTLSDGTKEGHEPYRPLTHKTAYLVATNIRHKPLLILPKDIVW